MNVTIFEVLKRYELGTIELNDAVWELTKLTTESPTAEWIALIPAEIVDRIQERAKLPKNTNWCHPESMSDEEEREALRPWLLGLVLWREYFRYTD